MDDLKVLVVCGYKNTGKTTLVCNLVQQLSQKGYKVGTIKHDGHDFNSDISNTDSTKHYNAGARQSAVFSKGRWMMVEEKSLTLEDILQYYKDNDLIIVEGCKDSSYPKIEVLRKGYNEIEVSNPTNKLGVYVDFDYKSNYKVFQHNQISILIDYIISYIIEGKDGVF